MGCDAQYQASVGFSYHRVARNISGNLPRRRTDGTWECVPPLEESKRASGIKDTETYISGQQNTVAQYITMFPILETYLDIYIRPWSRVTKC